jgi:hypothetical protein
MADKKKIEELERRIRDLEARPIILPVILQPPHPDCVPFTPYLPVYPQPFIPPWYPPFYVGDDPRFPTTITCETS